MIRSILLSLTLIAFPSSVYADETIGPLVHPSSTVLLIGDSLGVGLGPEFQARAKSSGYKPVTHSVGGTTAAQWIPWLKKDIEAHHPSLIVISLGTNDAGANIEWVRKNNTVYARLARMAMDTGAKVVWIGPPKLSEKRLPNADEVRAMIRDTIDAPYYESQDLDFPQAPDKIHSSPQGYKIWMDAVWEWMAARNIVKR